MLPVYIHNLKGYDAHLFITGLFEYGEQDYSRFDDTIEDKDGFSIKKASKDRISCIPNNEERYISFSKKIVVDKIPKKIASENQQWHIDNNTILGKTLAGVYNNKQDKEILFEIRFIDTFAFMASSLDELASNLRKGCKSIDDMRKVFLNTSKHFKNDEEFELMTKKGIYPYDYITSYDKLNERRLPYRKDFYSKLNNKECSEEDYNNAINVWCKFGCNTLLDYHNIYLISDVLLLRDIWENFRNVCYKNYRLDCEYYYTAPG